jgi:hypothetical protein
VVEKVIGLMVNVSRKKITVPNAAAGLGLVIIWIINSNAIWNLGRLCFGTFSGCALYTKYSGAWRGASGKVTARCSDFLATRHFSLATVLSA